jgi:hypothetical protein
MLLRAYLIWGLLVGSFFTTAAVSGWRMFPRAAASSAMSNSGRVGGGHGTGGYHSTWHGGK